MRLATIRWGLIGCVVAAICVSCASPTPPSPTNATSAPPKDTATSRPPRTQPSSPPTTPRPRDASRSRESRVRLRSFYAIDGDTIESGSLTVRVVGVDTPEVGECGYDRAKAFTGRFVAGGAGLVDRQGRDQYDRVLASVINSRARDLGAALLRRGLANARYDSTDGYDWHPREARYQRIDRRTPHVCGRVMDSVAGPEPWQGGGSRQFPDCATAEAAGAAPLRRSDPRFNPDLDGDGDGVACE